MARQHLSPLAGDAVRTLGLSVRSARIRRGWTVTGLAERVGVSHPTIAKIERGDPSVAIGTVFEAAAVVGVSLFDPDPDTRRRYAATKAAELALLPSSVRTTRRVDDDF